MHQYRSPEMAHLPDSGDVYAFGFGGLTAVFALLNDGVLDARQAYDRFTDIRVDMAARLAELEEQAVARVRAAREHSVPLPYLVPPTPVTPIYETSENGGDQTVD